MTRKEQKMIKYLKEAQSLQAKNFFTKGFSIQISDTHYDAIVYLAIFDWRDGDCNLIFSEALFYGQDEENEKKMASFRETVEELEKSCKRLW